MKLYEICSHIFREEGNVAVELRVESPSVEYFFGISGVSGRVSDIPAYLGNELCRCMPDLNSKETKYIITI